MAPFYFHVGWQSDSTTFTTSLLGSHSPIRKGLWHSLSVVYALNVSEITEAQLGETIRSIPEPLKEKIMTTYTMLIEKGKSEGKLEEKTEVIVSLFDEGFEVPKIAKIVRLPEEEVLKILAEKGIVK